MASKYLDKIEKSIVLNNKKGLLEGLVYNESDDEQVSSIKDGPRNVDFNEPNDTFGDLDNVNNVDDLDKEDDNGDLNEDGNVEEVFDEIRRQALGGLTKLSDKKYVGTPEYETFKKIFFLIDKLNEENQDNEESEK